MVFLMGPYRLLDPSYIFPDEEYPPPNPLAPKEANVAPDEIQAALRTISKTVSAETPTTVFIASDIEILTKQEAATGATNGPEMPVIDQSVAFAKASAGNAFVFTGGTRQMPRGLTPWRKPTLNDANHGR